MDQVTALIEALEVQVGVSTQIRPSQLAVMTGGAVWSVREVMSHSLGVTLKFAAFAEGRTDHPIAPPGDLVGPDHRAAVTTARDRARAAWAAADLSRSCHLPFGSFPAPVAAGINLFDVLAHTWDVAIVTDVALDCPDPLWEAARSAAVAVIGPGRDPARYGDELRCRPGAPPQERFLAYLGRGAAR